MLSYLKKLKETVVVGVVGGSNLVKQKAQLGQNVEKEMDYSFSENGLVAYAEGERIHNMQLKEHLEPKDLNALISHILKYIAELDIPVKRCVSERPSSPAPLRGSPTRRQAQGV